MRDFTTPACLLIALLAGQIAAAQEAAPRVINDRQIKVEFEKKLGDLVDSKETPDPEILLKQLRERKHHALERPRIASLVASNGTAGIYEKRRDSVLCFGNVYKCDKCSKWHGNIAGGFVITEDGVAVTNYHVMETAQAGAFGAMTLDGEMHYVEEVLAASKSDDLAIVKLSGDGFTPTPIMLDAPVGSKVIAISHPEGRFFSVSEGIISRYYRHNSGKGNATNRLAITADFAKGSSGCPIFSATGDVVGVVSSTNSIYYNRDKDGTEKNLQMVIKSCIPGAAIFKLLRAPTAKASTDKASTRS